MTDPEACPGCGCMPGDDTTVGCNDAFGCGHNRELERQDTRRMDNIKNMTFSETEIQQIRNALLSAMSEYPEREEYRHALYAVIREDKKPLRARDPHKCPWCLDRKSGCGDCNGTGQFFKDRR